ncbi:MAG: DUF5654 family protein [Candidatus Micrarchaeales archaeon]|nr:DUF5654 family protein [Candidatus Micrarchaeales archaeon]
MVDAKAHARELKKAFLTQTTVLMTTAFGFVAALAWNNAIQGLFKDIFGTASDTAAMFGYAVLITIVAVLAIFYISRISAKYNK